MNIFDQMREALKEARDTMRAANSVANDMADLLLCDHRLRNLSPWRLKELKRQLQQFDAHKMAWKDHP